ncbi:NeuD/PglB/VioB family sugar acetyltransferase [Gillisia limnaea]|uniref:NeuD/PglB/VioB family sugar acetyltransferase n=1 Tax=Gillisia limnaea TaxID=195907 RepID=UPI0039EF76B3
MKIKEDIIILGSGGHAKVIIEIIEAFGKYNIIGITDISLFKDQTYRGYPVLGDDSVLRDYIKKGVKNVGIGIGGFKNNNNRKKIFDKAKKLGFQVPILIHPNSIISKSATLGEGCVIFSGVNINTDVKIGVNNIIATGAIIDHETLIGDHVLISAGVTIGGNVIIEDEVLCALGSNIISGVSIKRKIVVGAGAVVVKDLVKKGTYIGTPAREMKLI